jgi:hypothetical protein
MSSSKSVGGLGFRDFVIFNQALLAKQGWRLLQNPSSLTAKIFKHKYHPSSSFMEASLGSRVLFAWRSIFQAKDLLSLGLVWRERNRRSIKIWKDKWLPTPTTHTVQSPIGRLGKDAIVYELIDVDMRCWNTNAVFENFVDEVAKVILNIPLSHFFPRDRVIWLGTTSGIFSVKSAYHMGKEFKENARG